MIMLEGRIIEQGEKKGNPGTRSYTNRWNHFYRFRSPLHTKNYMKLTNRNDVNNNQKNVPGHPQNLPAVLRGRYRSFRDKAVLELCS